MTRKIARHRYREIAAEIARLGHMGRAFVAREAFEPLERELRELARFLYGEKIDGTV